MTINDCNICTRFKLGNTLIVVLQSPDEDLFASYTSCKMQIVYVTLGSVDHRSAVQNRIYELTFAVGSVNPSGFNQIVGTELAQREAELEFMNANCTNDSFSESDSHDAFGEAVTDPFVSDILDETKIIHATSHNFGGLKQIKLINVVGKKQRLVRRPRARQYFSNGVLHREEDERKVGWYELFYDLLFVGALSKAAYTLDGYSATDFYRFLIVYGLIFQHWTTFTFYNNQFYHDDLFQRLCFFISSSGLLVMGICVSHVFDTVALSNTASIFLSAFIISRLVYVCLLIFDLTRIKHLTRAISIQLVQHMFGIMPAIPILALPVTGDSRRDQLRLALWGIFVFIQFVIPYVGAIIQFSGDRLAVSIEHYTERLGLLVVIVLGEFAIGFLFDHKTISVTGEIGYAIVAFLLATNIFWLYFRAETSKKQMHAIRRNKWTGIAWSLLHFPLTAAVLLFRLRLQPWDAVHMAY